MHNFYSLSSAKWVEYGARQMNDNPSAADQRIDLQWSFAVISRRLPNLMLSLVSI